MWFCPDEHAEAGASQKEQRQEQGRQQREADALKQQEKLRKRKEKKERRQSLAANTAPPRLSHVAQTDAGALPLFPEQKTDTKVSCCLPWLICILAAQAAPLSRAAAQSICYTKTCRNKAWPDHLCFTLLPRYCMYNLMAALAHSCAASVQAGI